MWIVFLVGMWIGREGLGLGCFGIRIKVFGWGRFLCILVFWMWILKRVYWSFCRE